VRFRDRRDAGRQLADELAACALVDPVVLGLARGGVPVAVEIADRLNAPIDVFVACKIGAPGREELGIGAIAEGWDEVVVADTAAKLGIDRAGVRELAETVRPELLRRVQIYRGERSPSDVSGRDVIVVDDGLATGVTAEAALRALRQRNPRRLILAIPICPASAAERMAALADEVICALVAETLVAVSAWYEDFGQVTDDEVTDLLSRAGTAPDQ
jgi:putative phosphoribosyl transferase